jgi:hypothetical protein
MTTLSFQAPAPPPRGEDPNHFTAKEVIEAGNYATCRCCEDIFRRRVETARYCKTCRNGYCEGQHGTFAGRGFGQCIICGAGGKYPFGPRLYGTLSGNRVVY